MAYKKITGILMGPSMRSYAMSCVTGLIAGIFVFSYLHYSRYGSFPGVTESASIGIAALAGLIWAVFIRLLNKTLDRLLSWRSAFSIRFISGYMLDLLLTFVFLLMLNLAFDIFRRESELINDNLVLKVAILSALVLFIYRVIYALTYSYNQYTIAQIETVRNERKQMELQFQALKSQVSPHYLFNSLNTISSLMIRDVASAEQFIRRLAQTYQYVLKNQDKTYVLLEEEIDFVKSYYYLLRIRFQQQVEVEINVPAIIMKSRIPPLTLQMLVENAVKHNAIRSDKKLFIYITAQDNTYLRVINTKSGSTTDVESFNVGLDNIRRRYQFFTRESVVIDDREKFTVALPVLHAIHNEQKFSA